MTDPKRYTLDLENAKASTLKRGIMDVGPHDIVRIVEAALAEHIIEPVHVLRVDQEITANGEHRLKIEVGVYGARSVRTIDGVF
jgi:hypothetical protein